MHPLLGIFLACASSFSIFGLGLLYIGWLFRREEPDRWRCMSAHRGRNAVLGLFATMGPTALAGLLPSGRTPSAQLGVLLFVVVPPMLGALIMGIFWGRLNHGKRKGGSVDPEI